MKKSFALFMAVVLVMFSMSTLAFAAGNYWDSGDVDSGDIDLSTQGGKAVELYGHIEPTIISVTMPSYIPFDMSRSVASENKVVSPRIDVTNNSLVPVSIVIDRTSVDLSRLPGVSWGTSANVGDNQIAIGLMRAHAQPAQLAGAQWLRNGVQNTKLLDLAAKGSDTMFIVGALGQNVPENKTFTVTPTLVVRATNM